MPDMLAIVSKAVFEKEMKKEGVPLETGQLYATDCYRSKSKALDKLAGGSLFLITVRPGDVLWLVGVLETPAKIAQGWKASVNERAIVDISERLGELRFSTGKGVTAAPGKLGMSLQSPRVLTEDDVALLRGGAAATKPPAKAKKKPAAGKPAAAKPAKKRATKTKPTAARKKSPAAAPAGSTQTASNLKAAQRELEASQWVPALESLLDAWRANRHHAIAAAIDELSNFIDRGLEPLDFSNRNEGHERWIALANRKCSFDAPRLLAVIGDATIRQFRQRMDVIERFPDDPRIAMALTEHLPPYSASTEERPSFTALFRYLKRANDSRTRAVLVRKKSEITLPKKQWGGTVEDYFGPRIEKALAALKPEPALASGDESLLDKLRTTMSKRCVATAIASEAELDAMKADGDGELDAVFAAVYENPGDDGARLVVGDALQERGDPRGEFIALQFAHPLKGKAKTRERKLLDENVVSWLEPLDVVIKDKRPTFERGFLSACMVDFTTESHRELANHPAWSTVQRLETHEAELIASPALRAMTELRTGSQRGLAKLALAKHRVGLETCRGSHERIYGLTIMTGVPVGGIHKTANGLKAYEDDWGDPGAWETIVKVGALTNLRHLSLMTYGRDTPETMAWFLGSPLGHQLDSLELFGRRRASEIAPWISALEAGEVPIDRIELRCTGHNTASGVAEVHQRWILEQDGTGVAVSLETNLACYDERPLGTYQLKKACEGLPRKPGRALRVRYIGGKGTWNADKFAAQIESIAERFTDIEMPTGP